MFARSGKVAIATATGDITTIALADLATADRNEAEQRIAAIRTINESIVDQAQPNPAAQPTDAAKPPQAAIFDAFAPFVKTRADERWLYVESDGLPHKPLESTMMVGITAWQQQVPLPQKYEGANAWQIPLKPELADKPISGKNALMRGAVALAANGIPIFNALNNRGVDRLLHWRGSTSSAATAGAPTITTITPRRWRSGPSLARASPSPTRSTASPSTACSIPRPNRRRPRLPMRRARQAR